jgi:hypothetical protein
VPDGIIGVVERRHGVQYPTRTAFIVTASLRM